MADDSNISLPSSGRVPASSTDQPKLAPIFGAAGSGKRAREIHGEGSLADSVQTITVSTSLQGQDGITKKLKVEQTTSVLSDGSATATTSSVATTSTSASATQSAPEAKSTVSFILPMFTDSEIPTSWLQCRSDGWLRILPACYMGSMAHRNSVLNSHALISSECGGITSYWKHLSYPFRQI